MAYSYQLYDEDGNIVNLGDVENRPSWYESGASEEEVFVKKFGADLNVSINPEKVENPAALDLVFNGSLADLKCQKTPLFTAKSHYNIDPTYAVTFNLKDALSYGPWGRNYPGLHVFFWVEWIAVKMVMGRSTFIANPLHGVWCISYARLEKIRKNCPIHWYNRRWKLQETNSGTAHVLHEFEPRLMEAGRVMSIRGKGGNAACSYVLDLDKDLEKIA